MSECLAEDLIYRGQVSPIVSIIGDSFKDLQNTFSYPVMNYHQSNKTFSKSHINSEGIFVNYENEDGIMVLNPTPYSYNPVYSMDNYMENKMQGMSSLDINLKKLKEFSALEKNWNGNGADAFQHDLLKKCENILEKLEVQPEIFPTACHSIQFEYEDNLNRYLEIEIFMDKITLFTIDENDVEKEQTIDYDIDQINKVVSKFYE